MTTRVIPARRLSTEHALVEKGPRRREALSVCEVVQQGDLVVARVKTPSGPVERRTFAARDVVRVLT